MTESVQSSPQWQSFVGEVRRASGVESTAEAETLVRATLRTLGESITAGELDELVEPLPKEARDAVHDRSGQARQVDKNGFLDRVSADIYTTDLDTTEQQVRAVLSTVRSWTEPGEVDDTVAQLPSSIAALFRG
ncbi:MAG: DUF2267 domain-containing protein [Saccharopolyspora sp.]|uniref:DUF2267 domain-containing protein n=1 Tax=Saccharopolyspora TaxID=1835 RepID=UPI00190A41E3|nr:MULTISPECIES: DUF2267 domain-containing protein [unclassified Saccharopolyspora]MBK0866584.1 DUF2267 domain-containing protein [Saccharopolyspora sp. HNM0986]MBQ6643394.1 DUF2267 domain-containing protein [Saccharopolyspora sp.]